jgi:signal transduction histidine kinase
LALSRLIQFYLTGDRKDKKGFLVLSRVLVILSILVLSAAQSFGQIALEQETALTTLSEQIVQAGALTPTAKNGELSPQQDLHRQIMNRVLQRNQQDLTSLLAQADQLNLPNTDLLHAYAVIERLSVDEAISGVELGLLINAKHDSKDWGRKYLKNVLLASFYLSQSNTSESIRHSEIALKSVPVNVHNTNEIDALYEIYDIFQIQYILDRNVTKAIEATEKHLEFGTENGRIIQTITILGNLSYLALQFEDKKVALDISKRMVEEAASSDTYDQSSAYRYYGRALYGTGDLRGSVDAFTKSVELSPDERSSANALIRLALAEAELGNIADAKNHLEKYRNIQSDQSSSSDILAPFVLKTEAEIMFSEGDFANAYSALEDWTKYRMSEMETLAHDDRRSMMATLYDTESELENAALTLQISEEKAKQARTFLVGSLILATILIGWVFWLTRMQKTLAISRDKALAGEKAKSQFLAVMSHEIRTPLNAIIPMAEMLQGMLKGTANAKFAALIVSSGQNLMSMLDNILTVSNDNEVGPAVTRKPVDIRKFAASIMKEFTPELDEKHVAYKVGAHKTTPEWVVFDRDRMSRILRNLIRNAVKFTDNGSVELYVLTGNDPKQNKFGFRIVDTGVGMDVAKIDDLMKPFTQNDMSFTRTYDGAGIGLFVCRKLIKAEGGTMDISSVLGQGTTVEIYFDTDHNFHAGQDGDMAA